jgi:RNA recognition motif-containing protein
VKNLPHFIQEHRLNQTFSEFGRIKSINIKWGANVVAFISFYDPASAIQAFQKLNGEQI